MNPRREAYEKWVNRQSVRIKNEIVRILYGMVISTEEVDEIAEGVYRKIHKDLMDLKYPKEDSK